MAIGKVATAILATGIGGGFLPGFSSVFGASSLARRHGAILLADGRGRPIVGGGDTGSGSDLLNDAALGGIIGVLVKLGIRSHLFHPKELWRIGGRIRGSYGRRTEILLGICRGEEISNNAITIRVFMPLPPFSQKGIV